jgi:hypothetical protein
MKTALVNPPAGSHHAHRPQAHQPVAPGDQQDERSPKVLAVEGSRSLVMCELRRAYTRILTAMLVCLSQNRYKTSLAAPLLKSTVPAIREDRGEELTIVCEVVATALQKLQGVDIVPLLPLGRPLNGHRHGHRRCHLWHQKRDPFRKQEVEIPLRMAMARIAGKE